MACIPLHAARELPADEFFIPESGGAVRALYLIQGGSRKRERRGDLQPGRGARRPFRGPGALRDVIAKTLNGHPALTAQAVTFMTKVKIPLETIRVSLARSCRVPTPESVLRVALLSRWPLTRRMDLT